MPMAPRFDPADPYLARVRDFALQLPGAAEKVSVGFATFYTKKVFVWFGMSTKADGVWENIPQSVCVLLPPDERAALVDRADAFVPGYIGPWGWLGFRLSPATDWTEIGEMVEESFRVTASKRLVAELDARGRS